jgi:formamidopyrimidine-DNA glycosylase
MPELPEVETIRRDLEKVILKKRMADILVLDKKVSGKGLLIPEAIFKNNFFSEIKRSGKLLIFRLGKGDRFFLIHLKMTGQLIFAGRKKLIAGGHENNKEKISEIEKSLPNKHTRLVIFFASGEKLFFNDLRKFGYAKIVSKNELEKIEEKYGIEPLAENFTLKSFSEALKGRKASVKAVLLNQGVVAGIGNIYADEALFEAKIRPGRRTSSLSKAEIKLLFKSINKIIRIAIRERGTTFSNYVDANGQKGGFSKLLKVYGREGEKCYRCRGIIKKTKVAGRGTRICEKCQK